MERRDHRRYILSASKHIVIVAVIEFCIYLVYLLSGYNCKIHCRTSEYSSCNKSDINVTILHCTFIYVYVILQN